MDIFHLKNIFPNWLNYWPGHPHEIRQILPINISIDRYPIRASVDRHTEIRSPSQAKWPRSRRRSDGMVGRGMIPCPSGRKHMAKMNGDWIKPRAVGAVFGAVAMTVAGFWGLGWTTAGTAEQRARGRGDQQQIGRGEERGRVQGVAQKLAIHQPTFPAHHLEHPVAADDGHVSVEHTAAALAERAQQRFVKRPKDGKQTKADIVGQLHRLNPRGSCCVCGCRAASGSPAARPPAPAPHRGRSRSRPRPA